MKVTRDQLRELYAMQDKLNKALFAYGREPKLYEIEQALFDELGELNHELKGNWCWWKKTQKPVDMEKVKEELADVLHFALCYDLVILKSRTPMTVEINESENDHAFIMYMLDIMESQWNKTVPVFRLSSVIGIDADELIEAYKKKNLINYNRIANGY